mgnify:FL=1
MRKQERLTEYLDWPLFGALIAMLIMGLGTVYSVAFNEDAPSLFNFSEKYGRQLFWIIFSLFLGLLVFLIDSDIYRKFAIPIYLSTLVLLVIVLFMPPVNGARAWIGVGSFGVQPAEFAKISTSLLLAKYISGLTVKQQNTATVLTASSILLIPMVLILLQPDAGTFVVFTSFLFVMYREGLTFDPIILKLINSIPGVRYKETWVGSHFIPILFALVFLSVVTLLLDSVSFTISFFGMDLELSGSYGVIFGLLLLYFISWLLLQRFSTRRERSRMMVVLTLGLLISSAISFGVDTGFCLLYTSPSPRD